MHHSACIYATHAAYVLDVPELHMVHVLPITIADTANYAIKAQAELQVSSVPSHPKAFVRLQQVI